LRARRPNGATRVLTTLARDWGAATIRKVEIPIAALDLIRSDCLSGGISFLFAVCKAGSTSLCSWPDEILVPLKRVVRWDAAANAQGMAERGKYDMSENLRPVGWRPRSAGGPGAQTSR
jgi:hypothetical protein